MSSPRDSCKSPYVFWTAILLRFSPSRRSGRNGLPAAFRALALFGSRLAAPRWPFPTQTPDRGPEHLLRAGDLACIAGTGCKLHLLYAWQAKDDALASLRKTLIAPPKP